MKPNSFVCPAREILSKFIKQYQFNQWPAYIRLHFIGKNPFLHLIRYQQIQFIVINDIPLDDYLDFIIYLNFNVENYLNEEWLLKFVDHYMYVKSVRNNYPLILRSYNVRRRCIVDGAGNTIEPINPVNIQEWDIDPVPKGLVQNHFNSIGIDCRLFQFRGREASIFVFRPKPECDNYTGVLT